MSSSFLSELTGLPVSTPAKGPAPSVASKLSGLTGLSVAFEKPKVGFDALDTQSMSIDLTNVYTDPIEDYAAYDVPLNAFTDWNETRAQNQSAGEQFVHGLTKALITTAGAFAENTVGVIAGLGNMAFGNGSFYDTPVGRGIDSINEWAQQALPNYYTKKQESDSILANMGTMNFWADKFANGVGYSLGSIASMLIGTGEAALVGKIGKLAGNTNNLAKLKDMYRLAKGVDAGDDVAAITKALNRAERASKITSAAKHATIGVQMSLAEASVEARETKSRYIEEKLAEWENNPENFGKEMSSEELDAITADAYTAGNIDFAINLPILATTNLMMFGKAIMGMEKASEKSIYDITKKGVGKEAKWVEALPDAKVAKAFSKSYRLYGNVLKNSLTEATQEAAQFAGSDFSINYVGTSDGMVESMSKALSKTFGTKEGLESIVIGALVGGGSSAMSRLAGAEKKLAAAKSANTTKALELLNSGGIQKLLENMESNDENMIYAAAMASAVASGNTVEAEKFRFRLINNMVSKYNGLGAMDYFNEQLDDLSTLPEAEFIERFGYEQGKTLQEQIGKSQAEVISDIKAKANLAVKRQDQVNAILTKYEPSMSLIDKMFDSIGSEERRSNKTMAQQLRRYAAKVVNTQLLDIDSMESSIDLAFEELQKLGQDIPNLAKAVALIDKDTWFKIRVGEISITDDNKLQANSKTSTDVEDNKLKKQIDEISNAIGTLNAVDRKTFESALGTVKSLVGSLARLNTNVDMLTSSPAALEDFVADLVAKKRAEEKAAANAEAKTLIENAETAEELDVNFPPNTSPEMKEAARTKREALMHLENSQLAKFLHLSIDEFDAIVPDRLGPIEEAAYNRAVKLRAEDMKPVDNGPTADFMTELSEIEARTFGEVEMSNDGSRLKINNRTYLNNLDDPTRAVLENENGDIVGVILTDAATGNSVKFARIDPNDPQFVAANEIDNAIVDALSYMIYLMDNQVRADQSIPLEVAKEENEVKADSFKADSEKILAFENEEASKLDEQSLDDTTISTGSKISTLSDEQLRAQIEVLKNEIEDANEILTLEWQLAQEAGFSKKEFESDPMVKDIKKIRGRYIKALNHRIKLLGKRKAEAKVKTTGSVSGIKEEIEQQPTEQEAEYIATSAESEIQTLEEELEKLEKSKKFYQDRVDGKYGKAPEAEEAAAVLKSMNKQIGVVKGRITKRKKLIQGVQNVDPTTQGSNEENNDPQTAQGEAQEQDTTGADIDVATGITSPQPLGITAEEAEELRKKKETTISNGVTYSPVPKIVDEKQSVPDSNPATETRIAVEGTLDIQLAPIETEFESDGTQNRIKVNSDGTFRPNQFFPTKKGVPVEMHIEALSDPDKVNAYTPILFEVMEDTDYWDVEKLAVDPTDHWKNVPIFVVAVQPDGSRLRVGLLRAFNENNVQRPGAARRTIYDLHKQGLTPTASLQEKNVTRSNIANSRTTTGEVFFYPVSAIIGDANSKTTGLAVVGRKNNAPIWKTASLPNKEVSQDDVNIGNIPNAALGQLGAVVIAPDGSTKVVHLSTRDMTEEGVNLVESIIVENDPLRLKFVEDLVGFNSIEEVENNEAETISIEGETAERFVEEEIAGNGRQFMMSISSKTGDISYLFFSKAANSLVKISVDNLSKALKGQRPSFSFIQADVTEKGFIKFVNVAKTAPEYAAAEMMLGAEFKAGIATKKYQVNIAKVAANLPYKSATGQSYDSYLDYLASETEITAPRPEGEGSKAILATDVPIVNSEGSVFYNIGMTFSNITTVEKPGKSEVELDVATVAQAAKPFETAVTINTSTTADVEAEVLKLLNSYAEPNDNEVEYQGDELYDGIQEYEDEPSTTESNLRKLLSNLPPVMYNLTSKSVSEFKSKVQDFLDGMGLEEIEAEILSSIDKFLAEKLALVQPSATTPNITAVASIESAPTDDLSGLDDMFDSGTAIVTPKAENLPTGEPVTTKTSTFDFNSYLIPPGVDAAELGIESSITDPDSIEDLGDIIRRQCNPGA